MKVSELIERLGKIENKDAEVLISVNDRKIEELERIGSDLVYCEVMIDDSDDGVGLVLVRLGKVVMF